MPGDTHLQFVHVHVHLQYNVCTLSTCMHVKIYTTWRDVSLYNWLDEVEWSSHPPVREGRLVTIEAFLGAVT